MPAEVVRPEGVSGLVMFPCLKFFSAPILADEQHAYLVAVYFLPFRRGLQECCERSSGWNEAGSQVVFLQQTRSLRIEAGDAEIIRQDTCVRVDVEPAVDEDAVARPQPI